MNKLPDHEAVKQIMNDVYNKFYLKWRTKLTQDNAETMMQEARELNQKYDCSLCRTMTAELIVCIENEWRDRSE